MRDVESLFAVVGLREQDAVWVDSQFVGVVCVEGMLDIDEGSIAAEFLGFGDSVQGESGFA